MNYFIKKLSFLCCIKGCQRLKGENFEVCYHYYKEKVLYLNISPLTERNVEIRSTKNASKEFDENIRYISTIFNFVKIII
jgi:hypothetical protein